RPVVGDSEPRFDMSATCRELHLRLVKYGGLHDTSKSDAPLFGSASAATDGHCQACSSTPRSTSKVSSSSKPIGASSWLENRSSLPLRYRAHTSTSARTALFFSRRFMHLTSQASHGG